MKRPALIPIICFLTGILVSGYSKNTWPIWPVVFNITALTLVAAILCVRSAKLFSVFICLFFFLLGSFRHTSHSLPRNDDISTLISGIPQEAVLYGIVDDIPEEKGTYFSRHLVFTLKAGRVIIGGRERAASGRARVNLYSDKKSPETGDRIMIGGKIARPAPNKNPAGFDLSGALENSGIYSVLIAKENDIYFREGFEKSPILALRRALSGIKSKAKDVLDRYLRGQERAMIGAVTLGARSGLAPGTKETFVKTGTAHVLAVSGLHVGIVAAIVIALLRRIYLPKWAYYSFAVVAVCAYAVFTGAQASSLRAALMFSLVFMAFLLQRRPDAVNSVALSAFCITFFCPSQVFQPGFIMSFMAVTSIMFLVPAADAVLGNVKKKKRRTLLSNAGRYLKGALSVSLAAWLGMAPAIASYFNIITPSAVIANLIAVPALFVMVMMGLALCILGPLTALQPLALFVSSGAKFVARFFVAAMAAMSRFPLAFIRVPPLGLAFTCVYYAAIALLAAVFLKKKGRARTFLAFIVLAAGIFVWNETLITPPKTTRVTFFNVKKADTALVELPDGGAVLIDGGRGGRDDGRDDGRYVIAPYLWKRGIRRLDCVVLTHSHDDHIGGLFYILENFKVGTVVIDAAPPGEEGKTLHDKFLELLDKRKIRCVKAGRGDVIKNIGGLEFTFLNPPKKGYGNENDDSLVFTVTTAAGNSVLFCGDATSTALSEAEPGRAGIIKVPHHGSGLGDMPTVEHFMSLARPVYAVIPAKNRGEVNAALLDILSELGSRVFITGASGAVVADETPSGWIIRTPRQVSRRLTNELLHTSH